MPLFSSDFASDGTRTIRRTMVPQKELIGKDGVRGTRTVEAYSGAVMGGTSRINQMLYTRGLPDEYNKWESEAGMKGWGWNQMRGYFLKSEKAEEAVEGVHSQAGESGAHPSWSACVLTRRARDITGLWKNRQHTGELYFRGFKEFTGWG